MDVQLHSIMLSTMRTESGTPPSWPCKLLRGPYLECKHIRLVFIGFMKPPVQYLEFVDGRTRSYAPSFCAAPGMAGIQEGRFRTKISAAGFASSRVLPASNVPALMILFSPNNSPWRQSVDPQSPQKNDVIVLPLSPVLGKALGVPLVTENPSLGTRMLVEKVEPVILWQSRQ